MMMATWRGTGPLKRICASRSSATLDLHDLGLFGLDRAVHELEMVVVHLLHVLLGVFLLVFRDVLGFLDPADRLGAGVADRDATFLRELVHHLHQLAAALLGERRNGNANEDAVVRRREPEDRKSTRLNSSHSQIS